MVRVVTQGEEGLGLGVSKEELTIRVIDSMKSSTRSDMKACHTMDQRSTMKRWIKWKKLAIGFKDGGTMNGHKFVQQGSTWYVLVIMTQQLQGDTGL
jgi:hypothetical protein